ncbi:MAG: hypothetical protein GX287_05775 [Fusobacteria bacterium]|nr:hypothetical protein [Fusobacteriota bacterium]
MENDKDYIYNNFINNEKFLNEIFNKFLSRYLNRTFYFSNVGDILNVYFYDKRNKITILEKINESEYRFLSHISNIILKDLRFLIRKNRKQKNIEYYDSYFYSDDYQNLSISSQRKYNKILDDSVYILNSLNISFFEMIQNKKYQEKIILELFFIDLVPIMIIHTEILNISLYKIYKIINNFYDEIVSFAKIIYEN